MVERRAEHGYPLALNRRLAAICLFERWRSRGWRARGGRLCPTRMPGRRGPRRPRRSSGQDTADYLYEGHGLAKRHEQGLHEQRRRKTLAETSPAPSSTSWKRAFALKAPTLLASG